MTIPQALSFPQLPSGLSFKAERLANGRFTVDARSDGGTIELFDIIGEGGATPAAMADALRRIGPRPVTLRVNSPGGDYFAGATIYNQLRAHRAPISVHVLGQAASAASIIIMAGKSIEMARNAKLMIHKAWIAVLGNEDGLLQAAALLAKIDADMAELYAERSGETRSNITSLMKKETWLSAREAVEIGLADAVLDHDGLPPPQSRTGAPSSHRDLVDGLRSIGFSKSVAKKIAAGGWPALDRVPFAGLTELVSQSLSELKTERKSQ